MEFPLELILFGFLIFIAYCILRAPDLFGAAMLTGIFSLLSAGVLLLMDAVDVSFTEAAVGAGVSTVLMLSAINLTDKTECQTSDHPVVGKLVVFATGALLMYGTTDMPHYGDPNAPIHRHVAPEYIEGTEDVVEIPNIVTAVLASYRGYDTFGEVTVVLTASVGAMLLLGDAARGDTKPGRRRQPARRRGRKAKKRRSGRRRR